MKEKVRTEMRLAKEQERELGRLEQERRKHLQRVLREQVSFMDPRCQLLFICVQWTAGVSVAVC